MFNKKLFVYFSKTHLFLYYKELTVPLRLEFEPTTIQDLERINKEWLRTKLDVLLEKINLKNSKAIIILSKDLVFDKIINEESVEEKDKETKDFIENIPLGSDFIRHKEFIKEGNTLITATNRILYETIIDILAEHGIDVDYVIPEIVLNKVDFNKAYLADLFSQKDLLKYGNFLGDISEKRKTDAKFIILTIIIILFLGILIGVGAYFLNQKNGSLNLTPTSLVSDGLVTNSTSDIIESSIGNTSLETTIITGTEPSTAAVNVNKDEIKVSIFNGTGIPGFASQIKTLVTNVGYKNITTTNADNFDYTNTIINSSSDITDAVVNEIKDSLKTTLKSFEIKKTLTGTKTISITTGEALKSN